jgi:iron(III) transport system substrate-binding protein
MNYARPVAFSTAALVALTLTACGTGTDDIDTSPDSTPVASAAPESDGTFTLYAGRDQELIDPFIQQFEQETGITVEVRYAGTTELAALLQEEGDATPADVFLSQDAGALGAIAKAGLFTTLSDDITSTVPAGFTSTDGSWVGITGRARVIVFDSETVADSEIPTSVLGLTDERWRGQVAIAPGNASFQSFVTALRVLEGEDVARQWLEDMVANDVQLYEKNGAILNAVNAGEVELGLINHYYWYGLQQEIGDDNMRAQLNFPVAGDSGGIVNVTGAGLVNGAADDADAIAFLEYLVSAEGQQYFVDNTFEYPLIAGVDAPAGLPALDSLTNPELDLSDLDTLGDTTALLAEVGLL